MTTIELVVLDMAGTTVQDDGVVEQAFQRAAERTGVADRMPWAEALQYVRDTMGQSKIDVFTHLAGGDVAAASAATAAFEGAYAEIVAEQGVVEIPGAADAISNLRDAGLKIALTTGFAPVTRDALLDGLDWHGLIDLALSPVDAGRGRPAPDLVLAALLRTEASAVAAVAVAGDTRSDVQSGRRAGAGFVAGVLSGAHDRVALTDAGADAVLDDVTDLLPALHERGLIGTHLARASDMRTLLPHDERQDVTLRPAATAKVWLGVGQDHETVAVPGVGLGHGDVLIAIELSTVCGSDVHTVQGHRTAPTPLVLGHESVGRVIAIGEGGAIAADGAALRIGDRAVWSVTVSCGTCDRCVAGHTQKCRMLAKYGHERIGPRWELTGGFASHVHLHAGTSIVRVPEALPASVLAPASCATATAWAAVARAASGRSLEGTRVLVYGAGLVGVSAVAIAADAGAEVTVVDPSPSRRAFAERFGGTAAAAATGAADIVIEASGHAVVDAIDAADVGGTVVLVGSVFPADPVPLDAESVVRRLLTVTGVHNYTGAELAAAVAFLAGRGRAYPFADVVGAVHPLDEVDEAIAVAAAPGAPLRVALNPR